MSLLQFAGVDVLRPDPDVMSRVSQWWDADAPELWTHPGYLTRGLDHLPIPAPPRSERPPLNKLIWPRGASRWGVIHLLMSGDQVAAAEAAAAAAGTSGGYGPATLTIKDSGAGTVTAQMFLIDVRPVWLKNAVGTSAAVRNVYVVTLVDARYFWWDRLLSYTFNAGNSWNTLLTNLVSAASGLTPTIPSIPGAYGVPSPQRWSAPNVPIVLLIDAVAKTLGMQFLYQRDGTCEFVQSTAAATADLNQFNLYAAQVVRGGRQAVADVIGNIPASVVVAFWGDVTTYQTVTLASLGLAAYGGKNGVSNSFGWLMADANAATVSPPRATTAAQMAGDYYGWALALTDATFIGTQPVVLTGFEDRQEWEFAPGIPPIPAKGGVVAAGVNPPADMLPQKRLLTRIVPPDRHDQNHYGDRPPPRYTYNVRLTEQASNVWGGNIQVVNTAGTVVDGPPIGWGGTNKYVMHPVPGQNPNIGDYVTAVPDPFIANAWSFIDPNGSGGSQSGSGNCGSCAWMLDPGNILCLQGSLTKVAGACDCADSGPANGLNAIFNLTFEGVVNGQPTYQAGGLFTTCCGCAYVTLMLNPGQITATATIQDSQACVPSSGSGSSSGSGAPFVMTLTFLGCCADGTVQFAGFGPASCNDPQGSCGNYYVLSLGCGGGCPPPNCDCCACCGFPAPNSLVADFSGSQTFIGIPVPMPYVGMCMWKTDCKPLDGAEILSKIMIVQQTPATDSYWQLSIGGAIYKLLVGNENACGAGTYVLVSGPAGAPGSVIVSPSLGALTGVEPVNCGSRTLTATVTAGDACEIGASSPPELPTSTVPYTWGFTMQTTCNPGGSGPGTCGIVVFLTCNGDGTWTLTSGDSNYAPTTQICTNGVLYFVFEGVFSECGSPVTIVISN